MSPLIINPVSFHHEKGRHAYTYEVHEFRVSDHLSRSPTIMTKKVTPEPKFVDLMTLHIKSYISKDLVEQVFEQLYHVFSTKRVDTFKQ